MNSQFPGKYQSRRMGKVMSLTSNTFLLFVAAAVLVYYLVPKNIRWIVLLVFSYIYYLAGGLKIAGFLLYSTVVTYTAGILVERAASKGNKKAAKAAMIAGILLNFGMLGAVKYTNFIIENLNAVFHGNLRSLNLLLPLGISFYTFQSSGYLLDVYWERCKAEKNPVRYALFVSFFPQILQGPIGRYSRLAGQLYEGHRFDGTNVSRGIERILWGFFKKMILADWSAVFVDAIFDSPEKYPGLALFGLLFYSIQLYADFSGGMDVVIGIGQLFGITMDENFRQPYFAVSITDFWHRWHITLGTWMKDYVFYPISLSRWMGRFGKWCKKKMGRVTGRAMPICIANIFVFLIVGIWHGAAWKFIIYGLYNGLIIGISGLLAPSYRNWKKALHISGKENWYHVFMILRTFLLVNFSWLFDRPDTLRETGILMKNLFTHFNPSELLTIGAGREGTAFTPWALLIVAVGCLIVFTVSVLKERGMRIRDKIACLPFPVVVGIWFCLFLTVGFFGSTAAIRGFIYAQF